MPTTASGTTKLESDAAFMHVHHRATHRSCKQRQAQLPRKPRAHVVTSCNPEYIPSEPDQLVMSRTWQ
jgi:hypothetical protein